MRRPQTIQHCNPSSFTDGGRVYQLGKPMIRTALIAISLVVTGCIQGGYDLPVPTGSNSFGMTGHVTFTSDRSKAEAEIRKRFEDACGGPVEFSSLKLERKDAALAPHYEYQATANCL